MNLAPSEALIADQWQPPVGPLLLLNASPALAQRLAESGPQTVSTLSVSAAIALQGLPDRAWADPAALPPGPFAAVVLVAPPLRALTRRWLLAAWATLAPQGQLVLAGARSDGIMPLIDDLAQISGATNLLGYRKGCRAVLAQRGEHEPSPPAWAAESGIAPGTWRTFTVSEIELVSLPGVFADGRLDDGTALLLAHLPPLAGARVLDIGCGCGVIGVSAALQGAAHVDLSDLNLLAVAAARENLARHASGRGRVLAAEGLTAVADQRYDYILSNPPFHAERKIDYQAAESFIRDGRALLNPGGALILVANRFLAYDRLLAERFRRVERLADDGRYHVLAGWV